MCTILRWRSKTCLFASSNSQRLHNIKWGRTGRANEVIDRTRHVDATNCDEVARSQSPRHQRRRGARVWKTAFSVVAPLAFLDALASGERRAWTVERCANMADRICKAQTRPWSVQDPACDFKTVWPNGLRRWLKAPVRKGVGSNPTAVTCGLPCAAKVPTCPMSRGYGNAEVKKREQPTIKSRVT